MATVVKAAGAGERSQGKNRSTEKFEFMMVSFSAVFRKVVNVGTGRLPGTVQTVVLIDSAPVIAS